MTVDEAKSGGGDPASVDEAAPGGPEASAVQPPEKPLREIAGTLVGLLAFALCFLPGNPSLAPERAQGPRVPTRQIELLVLVSKKADDAPVRGAKLEVEGASSHAYTDARGRGRLEPPSRGVLRVTASGLARARVPYEASTSNASLRVRLEPEVLITGRVVDEAGEPLATATVSALLDASPDDPPFPGQVENGAFRIPHLPGVKVLVTATAPGHAPESRLIDLADGPVSELVLVLERTGTLVATILDANGAKAPHAELELAGSGIYPAESRAADANGVVRWEGVPQGIYEARARSDGFVSPRVSPISIAPGAEVGVTLTLAPAAAISGLVSDASGAPIPGAQVLVSEDVLELSPREATTGTDGRFHVEGLLTAPHFVLVRAEGFLPFGPHMITPGGEALAVTLERAATIRGRVVDSLGHPVANALVEIVADRLPSIPRTGEAAPPAMGTAGPAAGPAPSLPLQGAGELGVTIGTVPAIPLGNAPLGANPSTLMRVPTGVAMLGTVAAVTSGDGTFVIDGVPSGTIQLAVQHPAHPPTWTDPRRVAAGATIDGWEIVLPESGGIDGRLVDSRGMPVPGVLVELRAERETVPRSALTERDGAFTFEAVLGNVVLTAMPSGAPAGRTRATVRANARTEVTITLEGALFSMEGRVLDPRGFPVEGAQISIASLRARTPYEAATFSARDGTFSFLAMPRPPYHLEVDHPDYARFEELELTPGDRPYEAHLQEGGTIRGRIVDRDTDTGIRDAIVGVYADDVLVEEDATDPEGRFAIARLAPGRYLVRMRSRTHMPDERSVTLQASRYEAPSLDLGDLRVLGAGIFRGAVTDAVGEPVQGARVYLPFTVGGPFALTDAQGRYELRNVAPGSHEVYAEHRIAGVGRGYRPVRVAALEEVADVDVRLSGRAADDESTPGSGIVRGVAIDVEDADVGVRVRWIGPMSAAELSGIRVGDVLLTVDGELVETAIEARGALRGPSTVRAVITVRRGAAERRILIAREQYRPPP